MTQQTYFRLPSRHARPKFLSQETHEGHQPLKKRLLLLLTIIIILDLIITTLFPPPHNESIQDLSPSLVFIAPCIVLGLISVCYLPCFQRKDYKYLNVKVILNCIACIVYGVYVILIEVACLEDALTTNTHYNWIRAHTNLSYSVFTFLIFSFFTPIWYLKAFIGSCYYIGIMIAYIKTDHPAMTWMIVRNIISSLYVFALVGLKAKFRWDIHLKLLDFEAWNEVHHNILDKNPTPIAVLEAGNRVIYSNEEFRKLINKNLEDFFLCIKNLKMRSYGGSFPNIDNLRTLYEYKQTLGEDSDIESPCYQRKGTPLIRKHENLVELLEYYRTLLDNQDLVDGDQFVFDGKVHTSSNKNRVHSYEITIRPLVEFKKLVLTLNNTTMRDLLVSVENSSEYKDKLLASVSHELKTPLNGNLGFLQAALGDQSISEVVKEKLLMPAFRSGKLLFHLISDILDYSQLQRQRIHLHYESRSIKETLTYCHQLLEHTFQTKGLKFSLNVGEKVPAVFSTDHDRLTQVTLNLISNALKFTMTGEVTIDVDLVTSDCIEIKVKDTGIGMQEEEMRGLFLDKAVSGAYSIDRQQQQQHSKGVGLGLMISHRIVKKLDDTKVGIRVESVIGQGSVFSFVITNRVSNMSPFGSPHEVILEEQDQRLELINLDTSQTNASLPDIPNEYEGKRKSMQESPCYKNRGKAKRNTRSHEFILTELEPLKGNRKKRVLIVDDEPFNILAIRYLLSDVDVLVDSANNGQEALEKITQQALSFDPYRLILMDCQMPIMDGYETTVVLIEKMKLKELPVTPIIGCTAFSAKEKLEKCISCGMKEVITKPIMKEKLLDIAKRYLEERKKF